MNDVTKIPTSTEFSVLVLITFLLKIGILGLVMPIELHGDEVKWNFFKYCSWSVFVFACHVMILSWTVTTPELFYAILVILIDD